MGASSEATTKMKHKKRLKREDREYFRTNMAAVPGAGSTGENESGELSTGDSGENKLAK